MLFKSSLALAAPPAAPRFFLIFALVKCDIPMPAPLCIILPKEERNLNAAGAEMGSIDSMLRLVFERGNSLR